MSLIFLAMMILGLAFSANVTNVRKLLAKEEKEHEDHSFVTSETCEGECDKAMYCGMPTELATLFLSKKKKNRGPRNPFPFPGMYGMGFPGQMPYFPGMGMPYGMGGMYGRGMYGGGMPYFGEEETEGNGRRLLHTDPAKGVCTDSLPLFLGACKKLRKCGNSAVANGAKICADVAAKGMCIYPLLQKACCESCDGCVNDLPLTLDFPAGCKGLSKDMCEVKGDDCKTDDEKDLCELAGTKCAKTCKLGFGVDTWCSDKTKGKCLDNQLALNKRCNFPQFQMCGLKTKVRNCKQAAAAGWCSKANMPWMKKFCKKSCGSCATCATHECPKGFSHKDSTKDSFVVSDSNCCIEDDKICSCTWQCMFTDNCCEDFADECCKEEPKALN